MRIAPICGEAFDSWLEATAASMSACWGDVVDSVGLIPAGAQIPRDSVARWLRGLSDAQAAAVSSATGLSPEQIAAMTFGGLLARAAESAGLSGPSFESLLWMRDGRCRFCPACLSENGGRWLLWWRLRWAFACPRHGCLLADVCPCCQRHQRTTGAPAGLIPAPGGCTRKRRGSHGRDTTRCEGELSKAGGLVLRPGHPALHAQRALVAVMESGAADFGIYRGSPIPFSQLIADTAAVGGRVLGYATRDQLHEIVPGDVVDQYLRDRPTVERLGGRAARVTATATASAAAVAATAAWSILSAPTVEDAGGRLHWLVAANRQSGVAVRASTLGWGRGISPVMGEVQRAALDPVRTPVEQIRHRAGHRTPTPAPDRSRAKNLPALVWPCWSLPLRCIGLGHRELRAALSVAITLVGTRTPLAAVIGALGSATTVRRVSRVLQHLHASPRWAQTRSDIAGWAAFLDAAPPPIDYQRRRGLACADLLPIEVWRELCLSVGVSAGRGVRLRLVRCWLFERLTTLPAEQSAWAFDSAEFRTKLLAIMLWLPEKLVTLTDDYACDYLGRRGIRGEPIVWSPSTPGGDTRGDSDEIDVGKVHRWIDANQPRSFAAAAIHFGADIEVIRYHLQKAPLRGTAPGGPDSGRFTR